MNINFFSSNVSEEMELEKSQCSDSSLTFSTKDKFFKGDLVIAQQEEQNRIMAQNFNMAIRIQTLEDRLQEYKDCFSEQDLGFLREMDRLRTDNDYKIAELKEKDVALLETAEKLRKSEADLANAKEEMEKLRMNAHSWASDEIGGISQELLAAQSRNKELEDQNKELGRLYGECRRELEKMEISGKRKRMEAMEEGENWKKQFGDLERQYTLAVRELETAHEELEKAEREVIDLRRLKSDVGVECTLIENHWKAKLEAFAQKKEQEIADTNQRCARMEQNMTQLQSELAEKVQRFAESDQNLVQMQFAMSEKTQKLAQMEQRMSQMQFELSDKDRMLAEMESNLCGQSQKVPQMESQMAEKTQRLAQLEQAMLEQNDQHNCEMERASRDLDHLRSKLAMTEDSQRMNGEVSAQREREHLQFQKRIHVLEAEIERLNTQISEKDMEIMEANARIRSSDMELSHTREKLAKQLQDRQTQAGMLDNGKKRIEMECAKLREEKLELQQEISRCERNQGSLHQRLEEQAIQSQMLLVRNKELEQRLLERNQTMQDLEDQLKNMQIATRSGHEKSKCAENQALLMRLEQKQEDFSILKERFAERTMQVRCYQQEWKQLEEEVLQLTGHSYLEDSAESRWTASALVQRLRAAITQLKSSFTIGKEELEMQWEHQTRYFENAMANLASKLGINEAKLEHVQRACPSGEDLTRKIDLWKSKYDAARAQSEHEKRNLTLALDVEKHKSRKLESALQESRQQVLQISNEQDSTKYCHLENELHDLKVQYHLRTAELKDRQRSADRARQQHMSAVQENRELLKAIQTYRDTIRTLEEDISRYSQSKLENTKKLSERISMKEVKMTLVAQLQQTQEMIQMTRDRWKSTGVFDSDEHSESTQKFSMIESLDRLEALSTRWNAYILQLEKLRCLSPTKNQNQDIADTCSKLTLDASRFTRAIHACTLELYGILGEKVGASIKQTCRKECSSLRKRSDSSTSPSQLSSDSSTCSYEKVEERVRKSVSRSTEIGLKKREQALRAMELKLRK